MSHAHVAATVGGGLDVRVADVDARESAAARMRCPPRRCRAPGTSEGRQLRRWLTQLMVTERVIAAEAAAAGLTADGAPPEDELLPDIRRGWRSAASRRRRWPIRWPGRCSRTSPSAVDVTEADVAGVPRAQPACASRALGRRKRLAHRHIRRPAAGCRSAADRRASARCRAATGIPAVARRAAGRTGPARARLRASRRPATTRQHPQALMSDPALAIDIGGTKIAVGLVGADGQLGHHAQLPTPDERRRGHLGGGRLAGHRGAGRRRRSRPRRRASRRRVRSICRRAPSARSTSRSGNAFRSSSG